LLSFSFLPEIGVFDWRSSTNQDCSQRRFWNVTERLLYGLEIQRVGKALRVVANLGDPSQGLGVSQGTGPQSNETAVGAICVNARRYCGRLAQDRFIW